MPFAAFVLVLVEHREQPLAELLTGPRTVAGPLAADLVYFRDRITNRYLWVPPPPPPPVYVNRGGQTTQGMEATVRYDFQQALSAFVGATLLNGTPSDVPYLPRETYVLGLTGSFGPLRYSIDAQYRSSMYVLTRGRTSTAVNTSQVESTFLLTGVSSHAAAVVWPSIGTFWRWITSPTRTTSTDRAIRCPAPRSSLDSTSASDCSRGRLAAAARQCNEALWRVVDRIQGPTRSVEQAPQAPAGKHVIVGRRTPVDSRQRDAADRVKNRQQRAGAGDAMPLPQGRCRVGEMRQEAGAWIASTLHPPSGNWCTSATMKCASGARPEACAAWIISTVTSTATITPSGPTAWRSGGTARPVPQPRSRIVAPRRCAHSATARSICGTSLAVRASHSAAWGPKKAWIAALVRSVIADSCAQPLDVGADDVGEPFAGRRKVDQLDVARAADLRQDGALRIVGVVDDQRDVERLQARQL